MSVVEAASNETSLSIAYFRIPLPDCLTIQFTTVSRIHRRYFAPILMSGGGNLPVLIHRQIVRSPAMLRGGWHKSAMRKKRGKSSTAHLPPTFSGIIHHCRQPFLYRIHPFSHLVCPTLKDCRSILEIKIFIAQHKNLFRVNRKHRRSFSLLLYFLQPSFGINLYDISLCRPQYYLRCLRSKMLTCQSET